MFFFLFQEILYQVSNTPIRVCHYIKIDSTHNTIHSNYRAFNNDKPNLPSYNG